MIVYVSGPYSADRPDKILSNVETAIAFGIKVYRMGHTPIVPHLSHWMAEYSDEKGLGLGWADFIKMDLAILQVCDAILVIGRSRGVNIELRKARRLGKTIFYSVEELRRWTYG